ncbi:VRR-NUC domain-containing protein [Sporomusa sphaeroides DSM 2875]|uniref:VRR-NUC domain-containing protein n=1 Tax=Sporomusa sphaeroides TaxID=47679 RepID=UPI00202E1A76|nr:VRR-NUC domain-containing protein [Sporomusa sphaeroides]MCM0760278.1 VRR-NUC domain-containing protein [Sporomusa sphaeroides DSM 2875]
MREKAIEAYLRDRVKALGGIAYKFVSPGNAGVPDRLVLLPGGHAFFPELKAPGKKSTPLQAMQQKRIRELGFPVYEIDSKQGVDEFIQVCEGLIVK